MPSQKATTSKSVTSLLFRCTPKIKRHLNLTFTRPSFLSSSSHVRISVASKFGVPAAGISALCHTTVSQLFTGSEKSQKALPRPMPPMLGNQQVSHIHELLLWPENQCKLLGSAFSCQSSPSGVRAHPAGGECSLGRIHRSHTHPPPKTCRLSGELGGV